MWPSCRDSVNPAIFSTLDDGGEPNRAARDQTPHHVLLFRFPATYVEGFRSAQTGTPDRAASDSKRPAGMPALSMVSDGMTAFLYFDALSWIISPNNGVKTLCRNSAWDPASLVDDYLWAESGLKMMKKRDVAAIC